MGSADVEDGVCLRRFGLNFDPPALVLEYERSDSGKLFHRRIGLRRLGPTSDPSRTAEKIRQKNKTLLAEDQVPFEQLVSAVARLVARQSADETPPALADASPGSRPLQPAASGSSRSPADAREAAPGAPASSANTAALEAAAEATDLPELEGDLDLNKLSTEELDKYKARMDIEYHKNQSKPGDTNFQYDVRVDHVLDEDAQSCGWDDSDED